jgi:hypothetical protein
MYTFLYLARTFINVYSQSISINPFKNTYKYACPFPMHDFFHNRTVVIPQTISTNHIHISLVSVWEVNFVLFNSMLKYVINRLMHAFRSRILINMHALFHIRTVIIPRERYQPEGFSPRVDIALSG